MPHPPLELDTLLKLERPLYHIDINYRLLSKHAKIIPTSTFFYPSRLM